MIRLLTVAAVLVLCGHGVAADKPGAGQLDAEKLFKLLDANKDGKLAKQEFLKLGAVLKDKLGPDKAEKVGPFLDKMFDKLDAKKQGFLTLDDFKKVAGLLQGAAGGLPKKE